VAGRAPQRLLAIRDENDKNAVERQAAGKRPPRRGCSLAPLEIAMERGVVLDQDRAGAGAALT
jgi:hypothetical protein